MIDSRKDSIDSNPFWDARLRAVAWTPDGSRAFATSETSAAVSGGSTRERLSKIPIGDGWVNAS